MYYGRAGVLLVMFYLYMFTNENRFLDKIDIYSRKIVSQTQLLEEGIAWYNPNQFVTQPLVSFGQGAAGIGYVFRIIGEYFQHKPFVMVADLAFNYVNQLDNELDFNFHLDFRNEIIDKQTFEAIGKMSNTTKEEHLGHGQINFSIENGVAGILCAQPTRKRISAEYIKAIENAFFLNEKEMLDVASACLFVHINTQSKESLKLYKYSILTNLKKAEKDKLNLNANNLETSLLKMSFKSFEIPHFNIPPGSYLENDTKFFTYAEIQSLLMEGNFPKTAAYFSEFNDYAGYEKSSIRMEDFVVQVKEEIETLHANSLQKKVMLTTLQYEYKLALEKRKNRYNPYSFVDNHKFTRHTLGLLNRTEENLLKRELIFPNNDNLQATYPNIKELSKLVNSPPLVKQFWKYDLEEGVHEISLEFLSMLTDRFKESKRIDTALMEILVYCSRAKETQLTHLIRYSRSENKKKLLKRLPLIFLFEVRLLIAYGLLEFKDDKKKGSTSIKNIFLRIYLKLAGIGLKDNLL